MGIRSCQLIVNYDIIGHVLREILIDLYYLMIILIATNSVHK